MRNIIKYKEGTLSWVSWIKKRIKNNLNFNSITTGETGCLSGDTIVDGQTKTLSELYSSGKKFIDTISITKQPNKSGCYYPKKSKSEIIDSGIKEVYEIEFEDGKKVLATGEHKFFKVDKNKITEEILENLKVGDRLKVYPSDYSKNHFNKAKEREQAKRDKKYNPQGLCKKCNTLFYQEKKGRGFYKQLCKSCLEPKIKIKEGKWFEWEDNILRQFYYSFSKEKLMELLPLRKSWNGILHRGQRLKLRRDIKFQCGQNAWTSENNPMKDKEIKKKAIQSIREYYKTNSSWNKGVKQWEDREHPRGMLNRHHSEEVKLRISNSTSGDKCHAWRGGISFEPYDLNFNRRFKKTIKLRDNYTCQICNERKQLLVHHIDYNKFNSNETNCITLCFKCHGKTNFNREYWQERLTKLLCSKHGYIQCMQQRLNQ